MSAAFASSSSSAIFCPEKADAEAATASPHCSRITSNSRSAIRLFSSSPSSPAFVAPRISSILRSSSSGTGHLSITSYGTVATRAKGGYGNSTSGSRLMGSTAPDGISFLHANRPRLSFFFFLFCFFLLRDLAFLASPPSPAAPSCCGSAVGCSSTVLPPFFFFSLLAFCCFLLFCFDCCFCWCLSPTASVSLLCCSSAALLPLRRP
mmetsp:Transcript_37886/g.83045  ORF Transcript_37886/g.83045 Transcript_37886/m.83045 type:complete len:207 (+) Transcript_37886:2093-2713(+)